MLLPQNPKIVFILVAVTFNISHNNLTINNLKAKKRVTEVTVNLKRICSQLLSLSRKGDKIIIGYRG